MPQHIAMTPLAGIASGVEGGLNAVAKIEDIRQQKQKTIMNDMALREEQAKEADMNKVTSKQVLFDNLQLGKNVRSTLEPFYGMFANPDGTISKKNTFEMMKFLESNPMAKQKMLEGRHADVQEEYNASKLMLEEAKQSGNEKKVQQATQAFNMASQKLSGITQSMTDEKGNRAQLVAKYGGAAEKFYNGESTADEFMQTVREQELAKQQAKDESKNQTEEQLTARALRGDKEAQAILDAMQERKRKIAEQNRAIIVNNPTAGSTSKQFVGTTPDGKPIIFDPRNSTFSTGEIPGGEKIQPKNETQVPVDTAAKLEMMQQGQRDLKAATDLIVNEDGTVNRSIIVQANAKVPFSKGRDLNSYILNAVEAKLRIESGAAVPDTEVKRIAVRFVPKAFDSDDTIKQKMTRLNEYLGGAAKKLDPYGRITKDGNKTISKATQDFLDRKKGK